MKDNELTKEELMEQLLNLYQQYNAFLNPIVKEYIAKLESILGMALVRANYVYICNNLNGED